MRWLIYWFQLVFRAITVRSWCLTSYNLQRNRCRDDSMDLAHDKWQSWFVGLCRSSSEGSVPMCCCAREETWSISRYISREVSWAWDTGMGHVNLWNLMFRHIETSYSWLVLSHVIFEVPMTSHENGWLSPQWHSLLQDGFITHLTAILTTITPGDCSSG